LKTIVTALVGVAVAWLRERGIIDLTKEQEEAVGVTLLALGAIFMRLAIHKAEATARKAQAAAMSAEIAAQNAEKAAVVTAAVTVAGEAQK
jgi:uncharacterized membrane protein (DUF441 family)